jgi:hypothetical protein
MKNSHLFAVISTVFLTSVGFANQNSACSSSIIEAVNSIAERANNARTQEDLYQCAAGTSIQFCGTQDLASQVRLTNACQKISSQSLGKSKVSNAKIGLVDVDPMSKGELEKILKNDPANHILATKIYLASGFDNEIEISYKLLATRYLDATSLFGMRLLAEVSIAENSLMIEKLLNTADRILFIQRFKIEFGQVHHVSLSIRDFAADYSLLEKIFFDSSEHDDFERFENEITKLDEIEITDFRDSKIGSTSARETAYRYLNLNVSDLNSAKMFLRNLY